MTLGEVNKIKAKERAKEREKFLKALDGLKMEYKGHGEKNPNHPNDEDLKFLNYTPIGIWNKAVQTFNNNIDTIKKDFS